MKKIYNEKQNNLKKKIREKKECDKCSNLNEIKEEKCG